ncbi:hypothetical protein N494_09175 [Clostridium botulinum A2B7 92]|uniref:SH3 domain-containing protein n=1 Tax=Clostridium botulinum TaxID=1491 RepID=UPI0007E05A71|nr:SH3 domain-containing protein [Clostridium botulinum]KEJ01130.1 hypothetical protein N494_09175 [Clostridium botulinum A2B7 92]
MLQHLLLKNQMLLLLRKKQILIRSARSAGHVKITGDGVRLRATPGLNGIALALLDDGTLVEYNNGGAYADGQEWVHVRYGSIEGYISKNYATFKI